MFHENYKVRITIMRKFRPDEVFEFSVLLFLILFPLFLS